MKENTKTPDHYTCAKCHHEWYPRSASVPRLCPKCHCRKWQGDKPQPILLDPESVLSVRRARMADARAALGKGLPVHKCKRCGNEWQARKEGTPVHCPKCMSTLWNTDRQVPARTPAKDPKRLKCQHCGHEWTQRYKELPRTCTKCGTRFWNPDGPKPAKAGRKKK